MIYVKIINMSETHNSFLTDLAEAADIAYDHLRSVIIPRNGIEVIGTLLVGAAVNDASKGRYVRAVFKGAMGYVYANHQAGSDLPRPTAQDSL